MTTVLAHILKKQLIDLNFLDSIAGLVQTISRIEPTIIEDTFAVSKFPASVDLNFDDCLRKGNFTDLVPNSKNKGILYFENWGTVPNGRKGNDFEYISKLRLVCWINNQKIQGKESKSIRHQLITFIRAKLENKFFQGEGLKKISVTATRIIENDVEIFKPYTYPIDAVKFLMHPFEAFAIDLHIGYSIGSNCVSEPILKPELC